MNRFVEAVYPGYLINFKIMKKLISILLLLFLFYTNSKAQDTFSIVAVDSVTGEVGSAGASCVDLFQFTGYNIDFLGELFPGKGAINTQAAYDPANQANARNHMNAGDNPTQLIAWLESNDIGDDPTIRQYGIVKLVNGHPQAAAYTGTNCMDYKNHITGRYYSIQGNILLGKQVLDSMEARFIRAHGNLGCKLMAALQGAKMVGADTRCAVNGSSSLFAFVKVSQPNDTFGKPSFIVAVKTRNNANIEPIDSLQKLFNLRHYCAPAGINNQLQVRHNFLICPNPAGDELNIIGSNNLLPQLKYAIKDVSGKYVSEGILLNQTALDISSLKQGIYYLEINDGEMRTVKKFVKIAP